MKGQDGSTVERLRPLVGRGGWDYCVLWEMSQDQRFLELKACCCGGAESSATLLAGGQEGLLSQLAFPSLAQACMDARSPQHRRTAACDALADLPSCIPLDSSSSTMIQAQALVSGVPAWMHPSELRPGSTGSNEAARATKALVPVPGGLVELFVQTHVPEDQETINFVESQFTSPDAAAAFAADFQPFRGGLDGGIGTPSDPHTWVTPPSIPSCDRPSFPWDLHTEQPRLCASSLNLFEGHRDDNGFFEGSADSNHRERGPMLPFDSTIGNVHGSVAHQMSDMITAAAIAESTVTRELGDGHEKESVKQDGEGRADSGMEGSDPGDDDEDQKEGRSGRRLSCKNLLAERRRRKKLNDRLYALRSLVPKISKMDRAAILGDAIEFVKELQNQVKKLQEQLEETNPEDSGTKQGDVLDDHHPNNVDSSSNINDNQSLGRQPEKLHQSGHMSPEMENSGTPKGDGGSYTTKTANASKQPRGSPANEEKGNQMEPQVEVSQVGANKFLLKVFCEHKRGGFVRLMEAMASLGLDVITVNVTTSKPLVLNIFEVEKRDGEVVQAEQVKSSLLRLAMDDGDEGRWPGDSKMAVEDGGPADYHAPHRYQADALGSHHQHAHHLHCLHHRQP